MIGETPTTGAGRPRSASRTPGTARIAPTLTTGLRRREQHHVGAGDRLEHAGGGRGLVGADEDEPVRRQLAPVADPPLLEVDGLARCAVGASTTTWVSSRSSVAGSRVTPGCQRSHSAAVTVRERVAGASIRVRTRWVAMSLSPRPNQEGSAP